MTRINLTENWLLRQEEIYYDESFYPMVAAAKDNWMKVASLPCDVHMPLIENGIIGDPAIALNSFENTWIEEKSWWFKKTFTLTDEQIAHGACELVGESIDCESDIFINGFHVGHHRSQTYPFRKDVKPHLVAGDNEVIIRVTSGLEHYSDKDLERIKDFVCTEYRNRGIPRGDARRVFVRKPSYVYGWDWNPRIGTVGLCGDIYLELHHNVTIRNAAFATKCIENNEAKIEVEVEFESIRPFATPFVEIEVSILLDNHLLKKKKSGLLMHAGVNFLTFDFMISDPKLWWPNGMGDQTLHDVKIELFCPKENFMDTLEFKTGIRTVTVDMSPLGNDEHNFCFIVNGKPMFAKGGNWETPDSIYARVTDEKYDKLVSEAREANFNMFRFNGVNAYERDAFYDCCDKYGIMLWHDFTLSCSAYPDHVPWWLDEIEAEIEYRIKKTRNRPSLALYCGSNECQWIMNMDGFWKDDRKYYAPGGIKMWNQLMPKLVKAYAPDIFFWNCSPLGGDDDPNGYQCGNTHEWHNGFMHPDMEVRLNPENYDTINSKFVSEYGCIGAVKRSSLEKYYGDNEIVVDDDIWKHHTNVFEAKTTPAAIKKYYDPQGELSLDHYLLYSGMFQGISLGYSFEAMRVIENCNGALIWSYNECRGEIGWSIVDYYTTRKISFYYTKRALAHQRIIIRKKQDIYIVYIANDRLEPFISEIEVGYIGVNGDNPVSTTVKVEVPPCSCIVIAEFKDDNFDLTKGIVYAKDLADNGLIPAIFKSDLLKMQFTNPKLEYKVLSEEEGKIVFSIYTDSFVHGVHFGTEDDILFSDEYFDLLPNETRVITATWSMDADKPNIIPKFVLPNLE